MNQRTQTRDIFRPYFHTYNVAVPPPAPPPPPPPQRFMIPSTNKVSKSNFAGLFFDKICHPYHYVFLFDLSGVVYVTENQVQIEEDQKLVLRIRQENVKYGGVIEHVETYVLDDDCEVCKTGNTDNVAAWTQEDVLLVRVPRISKGAL